MNLEFIGFTFDVIGKIMVAYTAIMVHYRFWKEHKIDEKVFRIMNQERLIGIFGVALIIIGYPFADPIKVVSLNWH